MTLEQQQLAAALAACKLKDEELEKIRGHIGLYNLFSCVGSDSYDPECANLNVGKCREIATEALSTTPDQALEQFAAKVLEQCAKEVEESSQDFTRYEYAIAIRAITELPE